MQAGQIYYVRAGIEVLVREVRDYPDPSCYEFRILEGPHRGAVAFVPVGGLL